MGHNLILFEEENYLFTKYEMVKGVRSSQVFFLTLLTVHQKNINCNYNTGYLGFQICLASSEVDEVDCHKMGGKCFLNCICINNFFIN